MRKLVVNADDFGLTARVNAGIVEAHRRGILTSTTILANGQAFGDAVRRAEANPELGVGVHLNLTEGRPVERADRVPSLVGEDGKFKRGPGRLALGIGSGRVSLEEVERELRAQIRKVQEEGILPTHVDGHKHIHAWPAIFAIVIRLAEESGVGCVRWGAERPMASVGQAVRHGNWAGRTKQRASAILLGLLAPANRNALRQCRVKTTDYFFGVTETGFLGDDELRAILWNLPEGTSELMCHPGYADKELEESGTRLLQERERELEALTEPAMKEIVGRMGIELVSYGELGSE